MPQHECYTTLHEETPSQSPSNTPVVESPKDTTNTKEDDGYEVIDFHSKTGDITPTGTREVSLESSHWEISDLPPLRSMSYRRPLTTEKKICRKAEQEDQLDKDNGEDIVIEIDPRKSQLSLLLF